MMKKFHSLLRQYKIQGPADEMDGAYQIDHPTILNYYFQVIASTGMNWDHVSVCLRHRSKGQFIERTCTWKEMCFIKDFFFKKEETVVQYHPAESNYVNLHPYVLHLWRPQHVELPTPETIMV